MWVYHAFGFLINMTEREALFLIAFLRECTEEQSQGRCDDMSLERDSRTVHMLLPHFVSSLIKSKSNSDSQT